MVFMTKTIVDTLEHTQEYTAYCELKKLDLSHRMQAISEWFSAACMANSDERALTFFNWLLQASADFERSSGWDGGSLEKREALKAVIAYKKIPQFNFPHLEETKKFILAKVMNWCYKTDDEAESDELFNFFCSIKPNYQEERKLLTEVLKNATDTKVSIKRLSRHFLSLGLEYSSSTKKYYKFPNHYDHLADIGLVIFNAWRRNQSLSDISVMMRAVQPIERTSYAAFGWLGKCAEKIAQIEKTHVDEEYTIHFGWSVSAVPKSF